MAGRPFRGDPGSCRLLPTRRSSSTFRPEAARRGLELLRIHISQRPESPPGGEVNRPGSCSYHAAVVVEHICSPNPAATSHRRAVLHRDTRLAQGAVRAQGPQARRHGCPPRPIWPSALAGQYAGVTKRSPAASATLKLPWPYSESIPGVARTTAEAIGAQTGADTRTRFPCAPQRCAWVGVAPASHESAGKQALSAARHPPRRQLAQEGAYRVARAASRTKDT